MSQITSTDTLANVQSGESLPLPDMGVHEMPIKPAKDQLPAQYSYDSFDQVLKWITHFSDIFGHHTAHIFDGHLALRYYYLSEGMSAELNRPRISLKIMSAYSVLKRRQKTSVKGLLENLRDFSKESLSVGKEKFRMIQV